MKHIPNLITMIRIIGSLILLITEPLSITFFGIYIVCGLSDVLDGYIARKTRTSSQIGATLDSIADTIFIGIYLFILIPLFQITWWMYLWLGGIVLVRFVSLIIGFIKYHNLTFLHTYANKATGLMLFFFIFIFRILGINIAACLVFILASISAIEELTINMTSKKLDRDIRSIIVRKSNYRSIHKV